MIFQELKTTAFELSLPLDCVDYVADINCIDEEDCLFLQQMNCCKYSECLVDGNHFLKVMIESDNLEIAKLKAFVVFIHLLEKKYIHIY